MNSEANMPKLCPPQVDPGAGEALPSANPPGIIAIVGLLLICPMVVLPAVWGEVSSQVLEFQLLYGLAFVGFLIIAFRVSRYGTHCGLSKWRWWFFACVVLRIIPWGVTPSDDTYRYVWEGKIQQHGLNPYALPPDAPALMHLRDEDWSRINHPDYRTIYQPLAQLEFLLVSTISPSILAIKAAHIFWDMLTVALLAAWLKASGRNPHLALIYGLCPLTLTAFAIDGHLDSLMLACLAGMGLAAQRKKYKLAAIALAGAIGAKIIAILLLGWLVMRSWRAALLCLACVAAMYLPYASAGWGLTESLFRFAGSTAFFGLGHPLITRLANESAARWTGVALIAFAAAWSIRRRDSLEGYGATTMACLVLVSPIVHFWYLTWFLMFACDRPRWSWLLLTGTMVFYFEAEKTRAETGTWTLPTWVWWATYSPFVVLWLVETIWLLKSRTRLEKTVA